ncbi:hypothetical protein [Kordia periserrulae]|nr:hypothetical protein [Kordia periserrulae]
MKKMFSCAAVIAVAFATFAFSPADKNNLLDEAKAITQQELRAETGTCDTKYKTQETFSECDRIHTEPVEQETQSNILGGY